MRFYEVYVAESGYQKNEPLTYAFNGVLERGSLVLVPYGRKSAGGFVVRETGQPEFNTKEIVEVLSLQPLPDPVIKLHEWLASYYPSGSGAITQAFVPTGLQVAPRKNQAASSHKTAPPLPELTSQQRDVIKTIKATERKTFLLHGETGSGKTRVYLERAKSALEDGKSALILVPEISLVPQAAALFTDYLGERVTILHSGLTRAKRNKNWLRVLNAEKPLAVIGTRSALFAPLKNIGFIAVDEMHEPAYKQESAPRYYGLRAAARLAQFHDAEIIYGSATPPVVEYFVARQTDVPVLRMTATALPSSEVKRSTVDLRDKKLFSRHRYLSDQLLSAIEQRLDNGEQSLIFLNRRGSFRTILCQACGWQAMCPRCDLPLTYHSDKHHMRCHTCGFHVSPPYACPQCGSDDIIYRSLGTKALVEVLQSFFPEALIRRFDTDNLAEDRLDRHFDAVKAGEVDILVGTQMLGKGLDLPKLSLVGIVNADTSLSTPDFSASERSYQLLHQAIGRVGRGHQLASGSGEVIAQSFQPDNPILAAALNQDWSKMYEHELSERRRFGFPPFCFLLKITVSRKTVSAAESYVSKLHTAVRNLPLKLKVDEPTPSFYERSHGRYNWQLIIRAKDRSQLLKAIKSLPAGDYVYDLDPLNLL